MNHTEILIESFVSMLLSEKGVSQNTAISYASDLKLFFCYNKKKPEEITEDDVKSYIHYCLSNSSKTNNRKISALKTFYKFLISENIIVNSPLDHIECAKISKNIPKYLTENEVSRLINACRDFQEDFNMSELIVLMLYATGIRVSELLSLRISMIDFEENLIKIIGKGDKERILPINKLILDIIKKMQIRDYLFVSSKTGKVITRQRVFQIIQSLGIKIGIDWLSPHKIRHSYATHLLNNGVNVFNVQKLLGHSDVATTEIYTHINDEKLKKVLDLCHPLNLIDNAE